MSQRHKQFAAEVVSSVEHSMHGLTDAIRLSLVALYSAGHVLLEGNPGLGKTELVKTLGSTLGFVHGRIQFTPDLMPADITGTFMPDLDGGGELRFRRGPIFTSLLLADEINRATPKTQAAMLEGMAERRVTVLGTTHELPRPFMVLATQNPIDHEGTYDLPAAQADRFMFKILMPNPDASTLRKILVKETESLAGREPFRAAVTDPQKAVEIHDAMVAAVREVPAPPTVEAHILNMVLASTHRFSDMIDVGTRERRAVEALVSNHLTHGLGPRTAIALMRATKAWSLLFVPQAEHAVAEALARIAAPVLRHRVHLEFDWQQSYATLTGRAGLKTGELLERLLADLVLASAPADEVYRGRVRRELRLPARLVDDELRKRVSAFGEGLSRRARRATFEEVDDFPLSWETLKGYRVAARQRARAGQVGAHLVRRRGQSLEFDELGPYVRGDDFRHIDWLASARCRDLLVRRFLAEETLNLVVSVDTRETMAFPEHAPKSRVASWLAFAVMAIGALGGDRVHLHQLFGPRGGTVLRVRGARSLDMAGGFLASRAAQPCSPLAAADVGILAPLLAPASVWMLITDLYFEDEGGLARAIHSAQRSLCWVIVVELDSWPSEKVDVGHGGRRIEGPGTDEGRIEVEVDGTGLAAVEEAIRVHTLGFHERIAGPGLSLVRWQWPAEERPDLGKLFTDRFGCDEVLRRLFRRAG